MDLFSVGRNKKIYTLLLQKNLPPVAFLQAFNVYQEVLICKTQHHHFGFRLCHVINFNPIKIVVVTY